MITNRSLLIASELFHRCFIVDPCGGWFSGESTTNQHRWNIPVYLKGSVQAHQHASDLLPCKNALYRLR